MSTGNVCPARLSTFCMGMMPLPHEPAEGVVPVLGLFAPPVKLCICRHCGCLYTEPAGGAVA